MIAKLTQTGTLADYHRDFEKMLNQIHGVPESTLLPIYLGGLRQPIKNLVKFQHPSSIAAAMALATEFDSANDRTGGNRKPWQSREVRGASFATNSAQGSMDMSMQILASSSSTRPRDFSKLPVVRLTSAERRERSNQGLCWYCPDKWSAGHACKTPVLAYMGADEDGVDVESSEEEPEIVTADISHMYSLDGSSRASSLELRGVLGKTDVFILVDTGSTHNFVHPTVAEKSSIPLTTIRPFHVYVGNGQKLLCSHKSSKTPLTIQGRAFVMDFFVLPIHGPDMILGMAWLRSLHRVTSDYDKGTLEFSAEMASPSASR